MHNTISVKLLYFLDTHTTINDTELEDRIIKFGKLAMK
jgi:hypothetical protein